MSQSAPRLFGKSHREEEIKEVIAPPFRSLEHQKKQATSNVRRYLIDKTARFAFPGCEAISIEKALDKNHASLLLYRLHYVDPTKKKRREQTKLILRQVIPAGNRIPSIPSLENEAEEMTRRIEAFDASGAQLQDDKIWICPDGFVVHVVNIGGRNLFFNASGPQNPTSVVNGVKLSLFFFKLPLCPEGKTMTYILSIDRFVKGGVPFTSIHANDENDVNAGSILPMALFDHTPNADGTYNTEILLPQLPKSSIEAFLKEMDCRVPLLMKTAFGMARVTGPSFCAAERLCTRENYTSSLYLNIFDNIFSHIAKFHDFDLPTTKYLDQERQTLDEKQLSIWTRTFETTQTILSGFRSKGCLVSQDYVEDSAYDIYMEFLLNNSLKTTKVMGPKLREILKAYKLLRHCLSEVHRNSELRWSVHFTHLHDDPSYTREFIEQLENFYIPLICDEICLTVHEENVITAALLATPVRTALSFANLHFGQAEDEGHPEEN